MTRPKRRAKDPNKVQLRDVTTRQLREAMYFCVGEVEACDEDGICPEQRPAFVALALTCARELRRRKVRAVLHLPTLPEGAGDE